MPSIAIDNFNELEIEILVNEKLMSRSYLNITNLKVDLSSETASLFSITVTNTTGDMHDTAESSIFKTGARMKIRAGYHGDFIDLIDGIITSVTQHYGSGKLPSIDLEGSDLLYLFMKKNNQRTFSDMRDSDIASEIIALYGLNSDIEDSKIIHDHTQQDNESDFFFLSRLANRCAFEFYCKGKTIYFKLPSVAKNPAYNFTFRANLLQISFRQDIAHTSESNKIQEQDIYNEEVISKDSAFIKLKGAIIGIPSLAPATVIEIDGLSKEHNGRYYLTRVVHHFEDTEGFTTHFET